jgi:hypothetical protein
MTYLLQLPRRPRKLLLQMVTLLVTDIISKSSGFSIHLGIKEIRYVFSRKDILYLSAPYLELNSHLGFPDQGWLTSYAVLTSTTFLLLPLIPAQR